MFTPEQETTIAERVADSVMSRISQMYPGLSSMIVTGTSTPGVPVENYDNNDNHDNNDDNHAIIPLPPPREGVLTNYVGYNFSRAGQETRKYFNEVSKGIRGVYGQRDRYSAVKTGSHFKIKDGNNVIFSCSNQNFCARNLLLELHDARFDIPTWLENRNNQVYDTWDLGL